MKEEVKKMSANISKARTRSRGWFLPYGCGMDREDFEQEAALAALPVEDKPRGYINRTVRNALGMIIERERAQKRYPRSGFGTLPSDDFTFSNEGSRRAIGGAKDMDSRKAVLEIPSPDRSVEEEVYVSEILGALSDETRVIISCRMNPVEKMREFYEAEDRPIPTVPSYVDISRHLRTSVASVMKAIEEAKRVVASA